MNTTIPTTSVVAPNSPKQTSASTTAPTVPTLVTVSPSDQIIEQISKLQTLESQKYDSLNALLISNPTPDNIANQKAIVQDISDLSSLRSTLFDALIKATDNDLKINSTLTDNVNANQAIVKLKEADLAAQRNALLAESQSTDNKLKMVDINTYYHKQYTARVKIMKLIVLLCFIIIFFVVLMHLGWLPQEFVTVLVVIILFAGSLYIGSLIYDMYQRSNINYDEYNWDFNSQQMTSSISSQPKHKKKINTDRSSCNKDSGLKSLYNSVSSSAASIEDSISSKATSLMDNINGTPDPSSSTSSLPAASTASTASTATTATTGLPSVQSKLSESFLLSKVNKNNFISNEAQPMAYTSENSYGNL